MENYLKLQPTKGKYVKISSPSGSTFEIFMVDPRTNERGTRVSRAQAIELLESYPHLVTLVQQVKDGKIVKQISDDEIAQVHQNQLNRKLGLSDEESKEVSSSSENTELKELVKSQSKMIEEQAKAIKTLQDQMGDLSKGNKKSEESKKGDEGEKGK